MKCVICNNKIDTNKYWDKGHNAEPIKNGRCCSACNTTVVIPTRLNIMSRVDELNIIRGIKNGIK